MAHCKIHPETKLVVLTFCPRCRGALNKGIPKGDTSRANGRLGGLPPLPKHTENCQTKGRNRKWDTTCAGCVARAARKPYPRRKKTAWKI